jgi:hypothetical protein
VLLVRRLYSIEYVSEGIYGNTVQQNLIVEMRACSSTRFSNFGNELPSLDTIPLFDPEFM